MTTPTSVTAPSAVRLGMASAIGVAIVVGAILIAFLASGVLILAFMAILVATGLGPVVDGLRNRFPVGRATSILITYGLFVVVIIVLGFVAIPAALHQVNELSARLPAFVAQAHDWAHGLRPAAISSSADAVIDAAAGALTPAAGPNPNQIVAVGMSLAEAVVTVITLVTLVFFWLTEHARLQRYALAFLPLERRGGTREAWDDVETRLGMWVRGQLTIMATIAIGTGLLYSILGVPSALLLALFAGLAEAIPLVGPIIGAIPAILLAATVSPELAGVVTVAYVVIQFIEGNVLVPRVMRHTVQISSFLVIVSLLVGAAVGGIVGAFLAIPIVAAAEVVLQRLQTREVPVAPAPGEPEHDQPAETASSGDGDHDREVVGRPQRRQRPEAVPAVES